jgi:hypothetical protein
VRMWRPDAVRWLVRTWRPDALEREAWRRAVEGFDEPVHYQGEVVGYVKKYSDRMLELLLKAKSIARTGPAS